MRQDSLWQAIGDRDTRMTKAVLPGKHIKLSNRRVILCKAQDKEGKVDGWRIIFVRLPGPEESRPGLRRVVTEASLSEEGMSALLRLLLAYAEEETGEDLKTLMSNLE